ncbi:hypothetical protein SAMN05421848_1023 [Kushneria avicenniae]|uniref:Uncharacterized protein n=1 Tax=Kushneria avicenniae TaxID=402385 RepID=A0A1I1I6F0_9GAMM|nr:hypothetical protein [Kushneria avicenniae]SFC31681.1 hypothetical protein SAMN05421848_1023 [Kushneria avicenniae]
MVSVERREGFNIKISRVLREATEHGLDLYLFVPGEIDLHRNVVPESSFYHNAIHLKRTYYSNQRHLPLAHSRLARRDRSTPERYRLSLSLYAYQYVIALERLIAPLEGDQQRVSVEALEEVIELARSVPRRMRRNRPGEDNQLKYFINIDNYMSWITEQRLLKLVSCLVEEEGPKQQARDSLLEICRFENRYRQEHQYNSSRAAQSPSRISNKMRLLRRLIEYPVTLKQKTRELGAWEERGVKALATGVVMLVISVMMLEARNLVGDLTLRFVLILALLYAMREVFKEDLRNTLWRWLRRGRAKWMRQYFDVHSNETVGQQREWLDYVRFKRLDNDIRAARGGSVTQREEVILQYRSRSKMLPTRFLSGYEETREIMMLDLSVIANLLEDSHHHVYQLEDDEISREVVERRYQLNLIARSIRGSRQTTLQRWKINMSRSGIVDIEESAP